MKRIALLILFIFSTFTLSAQNTKYYISFGLNNIVDDEFNNKLVKRNYSKISEPIYSIGIGRQLGNSRKGFLYEFHYLFSKQNKDLNTATDLSGGQIFVYTPYSNLYSNNNINFILSSGFGFGFLKFDFKDSTFKYSFRNYSLFLKIELGIDYFIKKITSGREWFLGVRGGYGVHVYGSDWKTSKDIVHEIPMLRIKGGYIKFIFGLSNLYAF